MNDDELSLWDDQVHKLTPESRAQLEEFICKLKLEEREKEQMRRDFPDIAAEPNHGCGATIRILDAVKAKSGWATDYEAAKYLGVSKATISKWRLGKAGMSDAAILKVATFLEQNPLSLWFQIQAERSDSIGMQALLGDAIKRLQKNGQIVIRTWRGHGKRIADAGRSAAIILIACAASMVGVFLPGKEASAASLAAVNEAAPRYTLCELASMAAARAATLAQHIDVPRACANAAHGSSCLMK